MEHFELYSLVALLQDTPDHGLVRGQVGTIVEFPTPFSAVVEFVDLEGRTYGTPELPEDHLLRLHYEPARSGI